MNNDSREISDAKKWVAETRRTLAYGIVLSVSGAAVAILGDYHDLPGQIRAGVGCIAGLVGVAMISESNFIFARKRLQELQQELQKIE